MRQWRMLGAMLVILSLFSAPGYSAEQAQQPVQQFQNALLHVMQHGKVLGFAGRKQYLGPRVSAAFDLPYISRAIIGRYWKQLSPADRRHLASQIRDYALATLASRFDSYGGQSFIAGTQKPAANKSIHIRSRFKGPDTDVPLDYMVHRDGSDQWRIRNVWFDGVSGTDIQQQEFSALLRDGGVARLTAKLDEIIAALSQQ